MRKQLKNDIKANCNKDLAAQLEDLMEKFNTLLAKIDADSADTGGDSDYESTHKIDID